MRKKTLRAAIFETVENYPKLSDHQIFDVIKKLGHGNVTQKEVAAIVREAKFSQNTSPIRFTDLAPDNHVYEMNIEKKGKVKFGVITDTHFGSKHHKREELEKTVSIMLNEGVSHFLCPGDLVEGYDVYRGQAADITHNTADDQIAEAIKGLPQLPKDSKYLWISGNHDLIWLKRATGSDPLIAFHDARPDVEYLGKYSAYVWLAPTVCVQLLHPAKGGGYTIGYPAQRYIDNLTEDRRPHICLFGHWHNPMSTMYKNVFMELNASFQGPNDLSIRAGWPNIVGGKIIEFDLNKEGKIHKYTKQDIIFWEEALANINKKKL